MRCNFSLRQDQAIKHLVFDGRYSYLETGSLISIKENVKDILIPSEEMKIQVYPMDYENFVSLQEIIIIFYKKYVIWERQLDRQQIEN